MMGAYQPYQQPQQQQQPLPMAAVPGQGMMQFQQQHGAVGGQLQGVAPGGAYQASRPDYGLWNF